MKLFLTTGEQVLDKRQFKGNSVLLKLRRSVTVGSVNLSVTAWEVLDLAEFEANKEWLRVGPVAEN